jgi:hypothetical protein
MPNPIRWAFRFQSDKSLDDILDIFNAQSSWEWSGRESYIFGDYLNCRPEEGVRLQVHHFPQAFVQKPAREGYHALLEVPAGSSSQKVVDATFRKLLTQVPARDIQSIEPYD